MRTVVEVENCRRHGISCPERRRDCVPGAGLPDRPLLQRGTAQSRRGSRAFPVQRPVAVAPLALAEWQSRTVTRTECRPLSIDRTHVALADSSGTKWMAVLWAHRSKEHEHPMAVLFR